MTDRNTPIFGAIAPAFWAAGLPVIPLHYHEKMPIPKGWSQFCSTMPNAETQAHWLQNHGPCNIGLALGSQSRLVMIDIDTDDATALAAIETIIPLALWKRKGLKGYVSAYRYTNEKSFQIKSVEGKVLVEVLSQGRQVVLPPSIHPTTEKPYTENCSLLEVHAAVPPLPPDVEVLLRGAFEAVGIQLSISGSTKVTDFISAGARDNQMARMCGLLSWAITKGERSFKEAEGMLRGWHGQLVEKVAGDDVDLDKGIRNLAKFLVSDVLGEKRLALPTGWDDGMTEDEKKSLGLSFTTEHVEWTFDMLKDYVQEQFERHPKESTGRANSVHYILDRIAHSPNLDSLSEERILRYIVDVGGLKVTMVGLRKRLKELREGEFKGLDHNAIADAVIKDMEELGGMRFNNSFVWQWSGSHWVMLEDRVVIKQISERYGSYAAGKKANDHSGILRTIKSKLPNGLRTVAIDGVNFANGFLTRELKLLPHAPEYGATYTLPFRYIQEGCEKPGRFHDFLWQCWGHTPDYEQRILALQEAMCATVFGIAADMQRAILLYGMAFSGKSVMLDVISQLVPDSARSAIPPSEWGKNFAPATLHDKLLNVCGELNEKALIDGERFKSIVAGDEIQADIKYGAAVRFRPRCAHWFASNHLPKTADHSAAFNRRWQIFHFDRKVDPKNRILRLGELIVAEEREQIMSWVVQAIGRLTQRRDYTVVPSHETMIKEVANINNSVRFFMTSGRVKVTLPGSDGEKTSPRISAIKLHSACSDFCAIVAGVRRVGLAMFMQRMRDIAPELGFRIDPTNEANPDYVGVTLAASTAP